MESEKENRNPERAKETKMTAYEAREIANEYRQPAPTAKARPASYRCYCGGTRRVSGGPDVLDSRTPYTCNLCGRTARH